MTQQTIPVEEALDILLSLVTRLEKEDVDLLDSLDRVIAEDMYSDIDVAPFDNSAMDGFAVNHSDLFYASSEKPIILEVIAHIAAGDDPQHIMVGVGQAARIMTGAPLPEGADAVVKVEDTETIEGDGGIGSRVAFKQIASPFKDVHRRGEEVAAGDVVLSAGEVVGPAAIGLLAATGHAKVPVYRRPRVAIISTGSELVEISEIPTPGKIRNTNTYSIAAQVLKAGGIPVRYDIVDDEYGATRNIFVCAAGECDLVVTSGGVSVGDFDYVKPVLEEIGEMLFCKVLMRPGNPQTLGRIGDTPFFGLPGNPSSTYVGFEVFLRPALRKMQGYSELARPTVKAVFDQSMNKRQERRYYLRGRVTRLEDGTYTASLSGSQSSALLSAAHHGNCFVILPEGVAPIPAGTIVDCMRLDQEEGAL